MKSGDNGNIRCVGSEEGVFGSENCKKEVV